MSQELKPCPLCGEKQISLNRPNKSKGFKGSINCPCCLLSLPREVDEKELIDLWNCRAASPTAAPAQPVAQPFTDALKKAFRLGETYWRQSDSESYSQNKKADDTYDKFQELLALYAALPSESAAAPVKELPIARPNLLRGLPEPAYTHDHGTLNQINEMAYYTADQMREYGRACQAATPIAPQTLSDHEAVSKPDIAAAPGLCGVVPTELVELRVAAKRALDICCSMQAKPEHAALRQNLHAVLCEIFWKLQNKPPATLHPSSPSETAKLQDKDLSIAPVQPMGETRKICMMNCSPKGGGCDDCETIPATGAPCYAMPHDELTVNMTAAGSRMIAKHAHHAMKHRAGLANAVYQAMREAAPAASLPPISDERIQEVMWAVFDYANISDGIKTTEGDARDTKRRAMQAQDRVIRDLIRALLAAPPLADAKDAE